MRRDQATALSLKITKTWPKGPAVDVWMEVLEFLDADTANAAYVRLRDSDDTTVTVARFQSVHRAIVGPPPVDIPRELTPDEKRIASAVAAEVISEFRRRRLTVIEGEAS